MGGRRRERAEGSPAAQRRLKARTADERAWSSAAGEFNHAVECARRGKAREKSGNVSTGATYECAGRPAPLLLRSAMREPTPRSGRAAAAPTATLHGPAGVPRHVRSGTIHCKS